MLKRITYLEKLDGMTSIDFSSHWATTHAEIARDLPGVVSYLQNHVQRRVSLDAGRAYRVDGIVELWFDSADVVSAASSSSVAERLVVDELEFLSGLTGGPVTGGDPHDPWPYKVWVLGQTGAQGTAERLRDWLDSTAIRLNSPLGTELNLLAADPELLLREALRHEPRIPEVAMVFGFADATRAEQGLDRIIPLSGGLGGVLTDVHLYLAREEIIIGEPAGSR